MHMKPIAFSSQSPRQLPTCVASILLLPYVQWQNPVAASEWSLVFSLSEPDWLQFWASYAIVRNFVP